MSVFYSMPHWLPSYQAIPRYLDELLIEFYPRLRQLSERVLERKICLWSTPGSAACRSSNTCKVSQEPSQQQLLHFVAFTNTPMLSCCQI
jgi:hypothetical protein